MKFKYIEKAYKAVIAGTLALGVVGAISTYASGPSEQPAPAVSPSPVVQTR